MIIGEKESLYTIRQLYKSSKILEYNRNIRNDIENEIIKLIIQIIDEELKTQILNVVQTCIFHIENLNGLYQKNLYRPVDDYMTIKELQHILDFDLNIKISITSTDISSLCSVLKLFIEELKLPLIKLQDEGKSFEEVLKDVIHAIKNLHPLHYKILHVLMTHFNKYKI